MLQLLFFMPVGVTGFDYAKEASEAMFPVQVPHVTTVFGMSAEPSSLRRLWQPGCVRSQVLASTPHDGFDSLVSMAHGIPLRSK